ncbi:MAG: LptF/LptG family permease [Planctomycetota bacterium]|nr:LptF/LptG family permease [Planctomycetota bacterium]
MLMARSVLREVARMFFAALVATTSVAFFLLSITFLKKSPGVGMGFLLEIFPLFFPIALQFTVPLSMLAAVVLTFTRIAGDGELTAMAASGIPLRTVARPVLAFAAIVAVAAFWLTDLSAPYAAARLRAARRDLLQQLQTSFRAGLCDLDLGRGRISFERYDKGEFEDVCVEWRHSPTEFELWRAQSGSISITSDDHVVVELRNAQEVTPRITKRGAMALSVGHVVFERSLTDIVGAGTRRRQRTGLTARELAYVGRADIPSRPGVRITSAKAREELARRSALAASAFFFAWLAIPLGVLTAGGGSVRAFLLGIGPVLIGYFPVVVLGSSLARDGKVAAYPALWAANALALFVGWRLMRRVGRR